jgi:type II secretory pathway component PulF
MTVLQYKGVTAAGSEVSGQFVGDRDALLQELRRDGVVLTSLEEESRPLRRGAYSFKDLRADLEQLAYLLENQVAIDQAMAMLARNTRKDAVRRFWEAALQQLREGAQVSVAVRRGAEAVGYALPETYLHLIAIGEETGDLKRAFGDIHSHLEFKAELFGEIRSALAYPSFLVVASALAVFFVLAFVLPRFASVYDADRLAEMPAISQFTLGAGQAIEANLGAFAVGVLAFVAAGVGLMQMPLVRRGLLRAVQTLPGLRGLALELQRADLFSALGSMIAGGVDLGRALRLAREGTDHPGLRRLLEETEGEVKRGRMVSQVWSQNELIPETVVSLLSVGEQSGRLDHVLTRAGQRHMENFRARAAIVLTFLEPGVIVFLGVFIGFIVVSIMLAVLSMSDVQL